MTPNDQKPVFLVFLGHNMVKKVEKMGVLVIFRYPTDHCIRPLNRFKNGKNRSKIQKNGQKCIFLVNFCLKYHQIFLGNVIYTFRARFTWLLINFPYFPIFQNFPFLGLKQQKSPKNIEKWGKTPIFSTFLTILWPKNTRKTGFWSFGVTFILSRLI